MAYAMTKQGSLDNCITYEFICDTVTDMNAIENRYRTLGSIAIVLGDGAIEVYISNSKKEWNSLSTINTGGEEGSSTGGLSIHVCTQAEVTNGIPNIEYPDETTVYLVASGNTSGNLYEEYIYVNNAWEKFGAANIDLSNYVTFNDIAGFYTKPNSGIPAEDLAETYAPTVSPIFTNSISMGRKSNQVIGTNSTAFGTNVTASGPYSHAEGYETTASGQYAHAEGKFTQALGESTHVEGERTIAAGENSHVSGQYNVKDTQGIYPTWQPNTEYKVFDRVQIEQRVQLVVTTNYYICRVAHTSGSSFDSNKWLFANDLYKYAEIVGNGLHDLQRSNARALSWDGNEYLMGDVYIHCNNDSTGGSKVVTETSLAALTARVEVLESHIASLINALTSLNIPVNVINGSDGTPVTDEALNYIEFDESTT